MGVQRCVVCRLAHLHREPDQGVCVQLCFSIIQAFEIRGDQLFQGLIWWLDGRVKIVLSRSLLRGSGDCKRACAFVHQILHRIVS